MPCILNAIAIALCRIDRYLTKLRRESRVFLSVFLAASLVLIARLMRILFARPQSVALGQQGLMLLLFGRGILHA